MEVRDFVVKMLDETDDVQKYIKENAPAHLKVPTEIIPQQLREKPEEKKDAVTELTKDLESLGLNE